LFNILASILILSLCFLLSIFIGPSSLSITDWQTSQIIWDIRIPRALLALAVGASLGLAGAITQALFRNPLADPSLLGVSSGAALAVALVILMDSAWMSIELLGIPMAAFGGALLSCYLLMSLSRQISFSTISNLLLCGIALNALSAALIGLCIYLASDSQLRTFTFWTLGSVASANMQFVLLMFLVLLGVFILIYPLKGSINALSLGEDVAQHIGINVSRLKIKMVACVALLCGVSVAFCGMIGFISLVAPQIVRLVFGSDQKNVLVFSMLLGGFFLLVADTLARTLAFPAEMPVGIFTSLIGAPYFLYLLKRKSRV
jgi:iron complex transport system permease protein